MSNKRVSELSILTELRRNDSLLAEVNNITSTVHISAVSKKISEDVSVDISNILPSGATAGQVLTFNGTNWVPA